MKILALLPLLFIATTGFAQPQEEKKAIRDLCGCFSVTFRYAETFSPDCNYHFGPRYEAEGIEWVTPVDSTRKKKDITFTGARTILYARRPTPGGKIMPRSG